MRLDDIKIFLDENIYVLEKHLKNQGINVLKLPSELRGMEDEEAFQYAQENNGFFLTLNGKHFVILVTPKGDCSKYSGICWFKFKVTRNLAIEVSDFLVECIEKENNIEDSIFKAFSKPEEYYMIKAYSEGKKIDKVVCTRGREC